MESRTSLKSNWKTVLGITALVVGLIAALYLAQNRQIFKSKAASEIDQAVKVTDENGNELIYQGNNTFQATSKQFRLGIKNLQLLKPE